MSVEDDHKDMVVKMVTILGRMLRFSISNKDTMVPISQELLHMRDYLTIQKIRFQDKLEFEIENTIESSVYYTPKFILQPIVENSVKYALVSGHITTINVSIEKQFNLELGSEDIVLLIKDNGPGMNKNMLVTIQSYLESDPMAKREAQFGLLNVQARIKMKFGKHYGLRIDSCEKKGTEVEIRIPVLYGAE